MKETILSAIGDTIKNFEEKSLRHKRFGKRCRSF